MMPLYLRKQGWDGEMVSEAVSKRGPFPSSSIRSSSVVCGVRCAMRDKNASLSLHLSCCHVIHSIDAIFCRKEPPCRLFERPCIYLPDDGEIEFGYDCVMIAFEDREARVKQWQTWRSTLSFLESATAMIHTQ